MKKPVILIISNVTSGLVHFRLEVLQALAQTHRVVVLAGNQGNVEDILKAGCEYIDIRVNRHGMNPVEDGRLFLIYLKYIRKFSPCIVLTYTIKPNIYGGIACKVTRTPYITNITGLGDSLENKNFMSLFIRNLYCDGISGAEMVFFQNQANCDFFIKELQYRGRYTVIPGSGVNLKKHCFEEYPAEKTEEPLVFSIVGRITRDKGSEEILKAAGRLKHKNIMFQFIGSLEGEYANRRHEFEEAQNVVFAGRQENIHEWMTRSHAVLHASYHEGMSNVLLEAAACGRPILATRIPGCKETFDEGISGIGFEPRDVDSLVEAVEHFIDLPYESKRQMGIFGRRKMELEFNRDKVIAAYKNAIEEIEKKR